MLKKIFLPLLSVVLLLLLSVNVLAAEEASAFDVELDVKNTASSVEEYLEIKGGDTLTVALNITKNPGINAALFDVKFPSDLTFVEGKAGEIFGTDAKIVIKEAADKSYVRIFCYYDDVKAVTEKTGALATLSFKVAADFHGELTGISVDVAKDCCLGANNTLLPGITATTLESVPAYAHAFDANEKPVITPSTCTEDGYITRTCKDCGEVKIVNMKDRAGHKLTDMAAVTATCEKEGSTAGQTCSACDYTTVEKIDKLPHDLVTEAAIAATCTEAGVTAGEYCKNCTHDTREDVPALDHSFALKESVTANWKTEQDGYDLYVCANDASHTEQRNLVEWETTCVTVTFETNGGTDVASVTVSIGGKLDKLPTTVKEDNEFLGWYTDKDLKNKADASDVYNADTTLYAGWEAESGLSAVAIVCIIVGIVVLCAAAGFCIRYFIVKKKA